MNEITTRGAPASIHEAKLYETCSPAFSARKISSEAEAEKVRQALSVCTAAAETDWLKGRLAAFFTHYYTGTMPEAVHREIWKDWRAEIGAYPQWALSEAFRWWLSKENEDRRRKPLPGDIGAICDRLMDRHKAAERMLRSWDRRSLEGGVDHEVEIEPRRRATPDQMRRILAEVRPGFLEAEIGDTAEAAEMVVRDVAGNRSWAAEP